MAGIASLISLAETEEGIQCLVSSGVVQLAVELISTMGDNEGEFNRTKIQQPAPPPAAPDGPFLVRLPSYYLATLILTLAPPPPRLNSLQSL